MSLDIRNKTALITGGAHRVGRAITLALAREGANVVVNYNRSSVQADETVEEAQQYGIGGLAVQADVSDLDQVNNMIAAATGRFGGVDILINSASLFRKTPFPLDDVSDWHTVTRILIDGSFYCANAVAPYMLQKGEGTIINIVDLSAWLPTPGFLAHSVGKSALLALTRQLALELAPIIRVNAVSPGPVLPPPDYTEAELQETADLTLLERWGSAEDVSDTVIFLIKSKYITGEYITVDGGERYGGRKYIPG